MDTTYYVEENKNLVAKKWLYYKLKLYNLEELNMDTGVLGLNRLPGYKQFVTLPSLPKQQGTVRRLNITELIIDNNIALFQKLEAVKKSLMQDLLTGKVRINHLLSWK